VKAGLLDVNVMLALIDEDHDRHEDVGDWFNKNAAAGWATCAHTQLAVIRLLTSTLAPNLSLSVGQAADFVRKMCKHPHHTYLHQDVAPISTSAFRWEAIQGHKQLPDLYLLALAVQNGARLVTTDRKINAGCVAGAEASDVLIL
jgi:uncharacterized protein